MGVDGGIAGCSSEVLTLSVGNVLSISLDVSLGQAEVDQKNFVRGLVKSHTEVIRFDVSVKEVPVVDVLDSVDHLIDEHEDSLKGELP